MWLKEGLVYSGSGSIRGEEVPAVEFEAPVRIMYALRRQGQMCAQLPLSILKILCPC